MCLVRSNRAALALLLLILLTPLPSPGQTKELWLDYFANFPAGRFWSYEINPGLSKGLDDPVWVDTYVTGNATYQDQTWLSTEGNLEAHYTFNTTSENMFELRPWLGANLIWSTYGGPLNIFFPFIGLRLEERLFWYAQTGEHDSKQRFRLRVSARFPLNNETLIAETWYLIMLAEAYYPINGEAKEVSADKRRFQLGLGYVVEKNVRVELQYLVMRSRNTQLDKFEASSRIVWLSVRNFFE